MNFKNLTKIKTRYYFNSGKKKAWFLKHVNDLYVKKANQMNYRSRASFKILEILKKYPNLLLKNSKLAKDNNQKQKQQNNLQKQKAKVQNQIRMKLKNQSKSGSMPQQQESNIQKITKILDLGCAPGSWSQVLKQLLPNSQIASVDLLQVLINLSKMKPIKGINFYKADARSKQLHKHFQQKYSKFQLIVSDMAPNFSGDISITHLQILQLNMLCVQLCYQLGEDQCNLVMKSLQGQKQKSCYNLLQTIFENVHRQKPQSSRSQSSQLFYVCQRLKKTENKQKMAKIIQNIGLDVGSQLNKFKNKKDCGNQIQSKMKKL